MSVRWMTKKLLTVNQYMTNLVKPWVSHGSSIIDDTRVYYTSIDLSQWDLES